MNAKPPGNDHSNAVPADEKSCSRTSLVFIENVDAIGIGHDVLACREERDQSDHRGEKQEVILWAEPGQGEDGGRENELKQRKPSAPTIKSGMAKRSSSGARGT